MRMLYDAWVARVKDKLIDQLGEAPDAAYRNLYATGMSVRQAVNFIMEKELAEALADFDFDF
jgi:hypothetical protein